MSVNQKNELIKEACRLEEDVLYSSKTRFAMGNFWYYVHGFFGIVIISGSILFGALSFANINFGFNINILSLVIVVLSMLQVFFNPYEQSRINKNLGDDYNNLKQKIRFFYNVEIHDNELIVNKSKLKEFAEKKAELDYKSSPIMGIFYNWAKRGINNNEHKHDIDK